MKAWAPSPGPIAVSLLALEERGADGSVDFGGRRIVLRRGKVVEVTRAPSDASLLDLLRATGKIDDHQVATLIASSPDPDVLDTLPGVPTEVLHDTLRTVWLDRLVHALAQSDANGEPVPPLRPSPSRPSAVEVGLFGLLLDALERRAAENEAEEIGKRASQMLEWTEGPLAVRGRKWAGFGASAEGHSMRIGQVLSSSPSAPSRIAALVRAGIVRLSGSRTSIPAPAPRISLGPVSDAAERSSIPPVKAPEVRLSPGAARAFDDEIIPPPLPSMPPKGKPVDDPFAPLERRISALEQRGAEPADRAAAWRALGDALRARSGSVEEMVRCYREAVAATPTDAELLFATAEACASTRHFDLALAYARAAIATKNDADTRRAALLTYARLARRIGRGADALAAARAASTLGEDEGEPLIFAGQLEKEAGLAREAVADWVEGAIAIRTKDPALSHALLASAFLLDPSERASDAFASSLVEQGLAEAALAVRARSALRSTDADGRRRALLSTAERAELAGRASLAADLLLAAFAQEPEFDLLYEPLDADLEASGRLVERAVVLESISLACGSELAEEWGVRSARAWLALESDEARAQGTSVLARMAAGGSGRARAELSRLAERGDPEAFDALEEAAHRASAHETKVALLEEITRRAGTRQPGRLAWAMQSRGLVPPSVLLDEMEIEEKRAAHVLGELGSGGAVPGGPLYEATAIARRAPETRSGVLAMLAQLAPRDARAALAAAQLAWLTGDDARAAQILEAAPSSGEGAGRALRALARAESDPVRATDAWARALAADPSSEEARVRLVASARRGDPDSISHALGERLSHATTTAEEARAALELADHVRPVDPVRASELAERALAADPTEPRAALLLLELSSVRIPSPPALACVRSIVGETAEGHAGIARTAASSTDALAATVRWAALAPFSTEPLVVALEQSLARGVEDYLEAGVVALLESVRLTPAAEPVLVQVLTHLATGGRVERACELALRSAALLGAAGPELATLALGIAEQSAKPHMVRDALELGLSLSTREERAARLRAIAAHHHAAGDTPSEQRALLRLLAVVPRDPSAVDRVAAIHAEAGNYDQMLATLALRTDEGATPVERAIGLLSLAKANFELLHDESRGNEFLAAALESPDADEGESQWLERVLTVALGMVSLGRSARAVDLLEEQAKPDRMGAHRLIERAIEISLRELRDRDRAFALLEGELARRGTFRGRLLLMFEQLSLDRRDVALAERVYAALIAGAMGDSGRRALRYRRARWLEKAGAGRLALAAYVEACEHASSTGAIASAVERLARELGDLDSLTAGLMALSRAAPHPVLAERLVRRAARVMLEEMARPERAFDVLFASWKESFSADMEDDLARAATATEEVDAAKGKEAFDGIFASLRARADDAWTGEEKARLLRKLARVHRARGDLDSAEGVAREAIAAQRADDPDEMALAGALTELAGWLEQARPAAARVLIDEAIVLDPANEDAKTLAARLPVAPPPSASAPASATASASASASASATASEPEPTSEPESEPEPEPIPLTRRSVPPVASEARFVPMETTTPSLRASASPRHACRSSISIVR